MAARRAGAEAAEAYLSRSRRAEVRVRAGRIERTTQSDGLGCGLRVDRGRRQGFASTTDLSDEAIRRCAEAAIAVAGVVPEDPDAAIPRVEESPSPADPGTDLDDPALKELGFDRALEYALRAEQGALGADPSVRPGEGSLFSWGWGTVAIVSSLGARHAFSGSQCSLLSSPVAERGGERQRQHVYESRRHLSDLPSPEDVGAEAGRRAARMLGARPIPSGRVNVVFDPMEGSGFWSSLTAALIGDAARRRVTFLAGSLGAMVASGSVTLADDPTRPRGPASRPFDGEGLPTSRRILIGAGRLESFLYDTRSARKAGVRSTASAVRGYGSPPSPGAHAPVLQPGTLDPRALLREAGSGLYVTQLIGFGTNLVTGDYSRGASGWWFERGEQAHPVRDVTLSGNLREMLGAVALVADDLPPGSGRAAPTFLIEGMVASGGGRP